MVYKIPMEDIKSLAQSFSELEKGELDITEPVCLWPKEKYQRNVMIVAFNIYSLISLKRKKKLYLSAKRTFNFEEYNFSQSTLEQVCK